MFKSRFGNHRASVLGSLVRESFDEFNISGSFSDLLLSRVLSHHRTITLTERKQNTSGHIQFGDHPMHFEEKVRRRPSPPSKDSSASQNRLRLKCRDLDCKHQRLSFSEHPTSSNGFSFRATSETLQGIFSCSRRTISGPRSRFTNLKSVPLGQKRRSTTVICIIC